MKNLYPGFIRSFLIFIVTFCVLPVFAQLPGQVILNVDYENNQLNSGITGVESTHATASDAAYMVSPGASGTGYAIAHKIIQGDQGYFSDGSYRSESDADFPLAHFYPGDEMRYECSVLLKDWTPYSTSSAETNIFQLKLSGVSEVPLQIRTEKNSLLLRFATANVQPRVTILSDVRPYINQWIHFRIDVKWTTTATGYMNTYMKLPNESDFTLVDSKTNYLTYNDNNTDGQHGYVKWGLYILPENYTRIVYHDDIRIINLKAPTTTGLIWGNSIVDANPAYLDGPYTRPTNVNLNAYSKSSSVYQHPYISYRNAENIDYSNTPNNNVVGTPWSDFSRATLTPSGGSSAVPAPGGRYLLSGWTNATSASTPSILDPTKYFEFQLAPENGYAIKFSKIDFTVRVGSATHPNKFALRSSIDGFTTNIAQVSTDNAIATTNDISFDVSNLLVQVNAPITFRLYPYGATATSGSAVGLNNFEFYGQISPTVLPVSMNQLTAKFIAENLNITWSTNSETNNDYFEIQASKDGEHFVTLKTIKSKNGNSTTVQNYETNISTSAIAQLLAIPLFLGFVGLSRPGKWRYSLSLIAIMVWITMGMACKKNTSKVNPADQMYIRLKQVDLDGKFTYSEIVAIANKK